MHRLIENLLSTASIEASHVAIEWRSWAIVPLVKEVLELMEPLATKKSIQLKSELPAGVVPILVDRDRIMQVLGNLIGNAIKFSRSGGTITVRAEQLENEVQFSVADNGVGISEDQMAHLFERFWQVPGTAHAGTGLGLFIVKGIVDAHRGKVWVESKIGVGSTFFFTLPVNPPDDERNTS
jgi:signal transduction histidine kinase